MELQVHNLPQRIVKLADGSVAYLSETEALVHVRARQGYPIWTRVSLPSHLASESDDQTASLLIHKAIGDQLNVPLAG